MRRLRLRHHCLGFGLVDTLLAMMILSMGCGSFMLLWMESSRAAGADLQQALALPGAKAALDQVAKQPWPACGASTQVWTPCPVAVVLPPEVAQGGVSVSIQARLVSPPAQPGGYAEPESAVELEATVSTSLGGLWRLQRLQFKESL